MSPLRSVPRPPPSHLLGIRPAALALLALGFLCLLVGSILRLLSAKELDQPSEGDGSILATALHAAFSGGLSTWLWAVLAAAGALTLLDVFLPWPARVGDRPFAPLNSDSTREALEEVRARVEDCTRSGSERIAQAIDELLGGAVRLRASDIHLSPAQDHVKATYRIDGSLVEVCRIERHLGPQLATRVKVLAQLDTYARRPLDGKLRRSIGSDLIEARVSTLPVEQGERVVLRITRGGVFVPQLAELGFDGELSARVVDLLAKPQGLFLVSGPVGSGKTTTLYSALEHIHASRGTTSSLVTLEDPIEIQLPFATQTQINSHTQMSFAQTLRSVLRQDPNVLMLGEIRDQETAGITCQAGLTGHLILSTLHVDRAAGTFPRLLDMGVEPFVLASTVVGALSQRLVRTLCTHCRSKAVPEDFVKARLEQLGCELPAGDYRKAVGCAYCEGKGFTGRSPIGELLIVDDSIRTAVSDRASTEELHRLALEAGMVPLIEAGLRRAQAGETPLEEVLRVVG